MTRSVDNSGVGSVYASFTIDTTDSAYDLAAAHEGMAVGLSGNYEVDLGANGGILLGKLMSVQTDVAVVQISGVMSLPYNAAVAPTLGGAVVLDGSGKIKASATGRGLVLSVDSATETAAILL